MRDVGDVTADNAATPHTSTRDDARALHARARGRRRDLERARRKALDARRATMRGERRRGERGDEETDDGGVPARAREDDGAVL